MSNVRFGGVLFIGLAVTQHVRSPSLIPFSMVCLAASKVVVCLEFCQVLDVVVCCLHHWQIGPYDVNGMFHRTCQVDTTMTSMRFSLHILNDSMADSVSFVFPSDRWIVLYIE
jgi:hypothetical protein